RAELPGGRRHAGEARAVVEPEIEPVDEHQAVERLATTPQRVERIDSAGEEQRGPCARRGAARRPAPRRDRGAGTRPVAPRSLGYGGEVVAQPAVEIRIDAQRDARLRRREVV